jgi:hypothetical protein
MPNMPPGTALVDDAADLQEPTGIGRARLRRPLRELVLAPGDRLDDDVAARRHGTVRAVEAAHGREVLLDRHGGRALQRGAAHPDRVDLVHEDDALAAPLPCQPLRLVLRASARSRRPCR